MQKIFIVLPCLLLFSCNQNNDSLTSNLTISNNPSSYQASLDSYERAADDLTEDDCDQAEPMPILNESFFQNHAFDLEDNSTSIETGEFPNGDKIFISYSGCENRKIAVNISTSRYYGNNNDMKYWTTAVNNLLKEVQLHKNSSNEINEELNLIIHFLSNHTLSKQQKVNYSKSNLGHQLILESIEEGQSNSSIIHLTIELNQQI
jgi:hypothetical protein